VSDRYFAYLKEAKRRGEPSVDVAAKALSRFGCVASWVSDRYFAYLEAKRRGEPSVDVAAKALSRFERLVGRGAPLPVTAFTNATAALIESHGQI
jgi:hypothetical protein